MPARFIPFFNPKRLDEKPTLIQVSLIESVHLDGASIVCTMKDDGTDYVTEFDSEQEAYGQFMTLTKLLNHE